MIFNFAWWIILSTLGVILGLIIINSKSINCKNRTEIAILIIFPLSITGFIFSCVFNTPSDYIAWEKTAVLTIVVISIIVGTLIISIYLFLKSNKEMNEECKI